MFQTKEQDKTPKEVSELEIGNLPKKEFRVVIIKMIKNLGEEWMHKEARNFQQKFRDYKEQPIKDEE